MGKFRGLAQNSAFCGKLWSQTIGCQIELNESIRFSGVNRIKSKLFFWQIRMHSTGNQCVRHVCNKLLYLLSDKNFVVIATVN